MNARSPAAAPWPGSGHDQHDVHIRSRTADHREPKRKKTRGVSVRVAGARRGSGSSPPRSTCSSTAASMARRSAPSSARSGSPQAPGSFYRHFPSKDAVFVASIERYASEHIDEMLRALDELHRIEDPVEWLGRYYRMRLDALRRFDPVWRLIDAEGARFPELRGSFTAALELDQWNLGWDESPIPAIAMAALVGYANLAELEHGPYHDIPVDDFIDSLVDLVGIRLLPPTRKG